MFNENFGYGIQRGTCSPPLDTLVYRDNYPDGTPRTLVFFNRGEVDSIYRLHRNGTAREVLRYRDGHLEGQQIQQYEDGTISKEYACVRGKREGPFVMWYPNGMSSREVHYRDGEEVFGHRKAWDSTGKPLYSWHGTGAPQDSTMLYRENYPDGKMRMEIRYSKGVYDSVTRYWNCEGVLVREEWYDKGRWIRSHSPLTGDSTTIPDEMRFAKLDPGLLPSFDDIYTYFVRKKPDLRGSIVMHIETDDRGKVVLAYPIKSTTGCREMDMMVWARIQGMSLEKISGTGCSLFRWPLHFEPSD